MIITFKHLYSSYEDKRKTQQPSVTILKSMTEYNQLAESVGSKKINYPGLIDFSKQTALHINLGAKGESGFTLVESLDKEEKNIKIEVIQSSGFDTISSPCCTVVVDCLLDSDVVFQVTEKKLEEKDQSGQNQFWEILNQTDKIQKQLSLKMAEVLIPNSAIYNEDNNSKSLENPHSSINAEFKL